KLITAEKTWTIGDEIGSGGFAVAIRAQEIGSDKPSVLKQMISLDSTAANEEKAHRLEEIKNEMKHTIHCGDHRYSINVHHFEPITFLEGDITTGEIRYGLMLEEFTDGDLQNAIHGDPKKPDQKPEPLTLNEKKVIANDLGNILKMLANKRVVHRDLKPDNLAVVKNEAKKITGLKAFDYGMAVDIGEKDVKGAGTPGYQAPEAFWDPDDKVNVMEGVFFDTVNVGTSAKADCWSVGVILCEELLGYELVNPDSPTFYNDSSLIRQTTEEVQSLIDEYQAESKLFEGAPESSLRETIKKLLIADPEQRLDGVELKTALDNLRIQEETLVSARGIPPTQTEGSTLAQLKEQGPTSVMLWQSETGVPYEYNLSTLNDNGELSTATALVTADGIQLRGQEFSYESFRELMEIDRTLLLMASEVFSENASETSTMTLSESVSDIDTVSDPEEFFGENYELDFGQNREG
ncbi:hypothetical protein SCG7086_DG_00010, partial [Chlamydiales bacterium SCGC AG-110-P3]